MDESTVPEYTQLREARGLSTSGLARKAGVSEKTARKWERGDKTLRPESYKKIADALTTTVVSVGGAPSPEESAAISDELRDIKAALAGVQAEFRDFVARFTAVDDERDKRDAATKAAEEATAASSVVGPPAPVRKRGPDRRRRAS